jgi:biopolymer transport protein ExbD
MADLVFLLLIFFMLTSTLVSPNAIKLLLPSSNSDRAFDPKAKVLTLYIDASLNYYLGENLINQNELGEMISRELIGTKDATIVLRSDATVPVQNVVYVIDAVNDVNKKFSTMHKVILATKPM